VSWIFVDPSPFPRRILSCYPPLNGCGAKAASALFSLECTQFAEEAVIGDPFFFFMFGCVGVCARPSHWLCGVSEWIHYFWLLLRGWGLVDSRSLLMDASSRGQIRFFSRFSLISLVRCLDLGVSFLIRCFAVVFSPINDPDLVC
jgi:hypothetical protein